MPDNRESRPARLFGVAQGDEGWEGEVRRLLADQASGVRHPANDLAGPAISRARRARRRRHVIGLAGVVAGTVLATGVLMHDWRVAGTSSDSDESEFGVVSELSGEQPSPLPEERPRLAMGHAMPVSMSADLIGAGTTGGLVLATADGEQIDLGPIREVSSAHRFGRGWAVAGGGQGTARLWWVTAGQAPLALLAGMDAIVVGHGQVAWQRGVMLSAASLSEDGQLVGRVSTTAPYGDGYPVGFLHDSVLLERTESTGWDTWHPAQGDYQPTWTDDVVRVYGPLADGASSVGLMATQPGIEGSCLAKLDAELVVAGTSCVTTQELPPDAPAAVSPDGQWLFSGGSQPAGSLLVDLDIAFDGQPDQAVTAWAEASPAAVAVPVWLGPDRVLFATGDGLVQLWPDRLRAGDDGAVERIPVAGGAPLVVDPV
jgi:hypothetical protein